jgi:hypothetical protein
VAEVGILQALRGSFKFSFNLNLKFAADSESDSESDSDSEFSESVSIVPHPGRDGPGASRNLKTRTLVDSLSLVPLPVALHSIGTYRDTQAYNEQLALQVEVLSTLADDSDSESDSQSASG